MSNMGYCRFQNTLSDLWDCEHHWWDDDLSPAETQAKEKMLKLCKKIVEDTDETG